MQIINEPFLESMHCFWEGANHQHKKNKVMYTPLLDNAISLLTVLFSVRSLRMLIPLSTLEILSLKLVLWILKLIVELKKLAKSLVKWENRSAQTDISLNTEISIYQSCVLTVHLCSSKTRTIYRHHVKTLERFYQKCCRHILNIKWQSFTSDTAVLQQAKTPNRETDHSQSTVLSSASQENGR